MKLIEREKLEMVGGWSCDERDRSACRNGHGCHCREITALRDTLEYWKDAARKSVSRPHKD
jgi:hypothetical protein